VTRSPPFTYRHSQWHSAPSIVMQVSSNRKSWIRAPSTRTSVEVSMIVLPQMEAPGVPQTASHGP
jgi:hypothetical protein